MNFHSFKLFHSLKKLIVFAPIVILHDTMEKWVSIKTSVISNNETGLDLRVGPRISGTLQLIGPPAGSIGQKRRIFADSEISIYSVFSCRINWIEPRS